MYLRFQALVAAGYISDYSGKKTKVNGEKGRSEELVLVGAPSPNFERGTSRRLGSSSLTDEKSEKLENIKGQKTVLLLEQT